MKQQHLLLGLTVGVVAAAPGKPGKGPCHPSKGIKSIQLGPRPYWLVDDMDDGPLKDKLTSCMAIDKFKPSPWSIAHRGGGTLMLPEHTRESNLAGARMGAGILECDVAFTQDRELVCRHSQCDLAYTTNIVTIPELNSKCTKPFAAAENGKPASATCCTSDITLAEFSTLCGTMEGANPNASTPEEYLRGTPAWRTDLYAECGTVMSLREHIALTDSLGLLFTAELKTPEVEMPFEGDYTQEAFAQALVDEFRAADIDPSRVYLQSFLYDDMLYWLEAEPEFAKQAAFLDSSGETPETLPEAVELLEKRAADGVRIIAPPTQYLVTVDEDNEIVPSAYALKAKELGLDIMTWTVERSGLLGDGGGYYYSTIANATNNDGDVYNLLHVLWEDIGVMGVFSDWSATTTYYANCFGIF